MSGKRFLVAATVLAATTTVGDVDATWSIVMTDEQTNEVAVGTVTCLTSFDLLAIVPVVVVEEGGAAVQAAGDFGGTRRPIIFQQLMLDTPPDEILEILEDVSGHQSRQYGIADTDGEAVTFTGSQNGAYAGGLTGAQGSIRYAVQGNVLAGACVIEAIEQALLMTDGDIPAKLMAGMQAAREQGGDGRCSCSQFNPPACGCPVPSFTKSGHIGGMVVARPGDSDDPVCNANGCVDGDYFMRLNVAFQSSGAPDPVAQLQEQFDDWRSDLVGRPDAGQSTIAFDPALIPPNGVSTTQLIITLRDWQGLPIDVSIESVDVAHTDDSAGLSIIGDVSDLGGGVFSVELTAGEQPGVDRFDVTVDDGIRPVQIMPDPALVYYALGDVDGDGTVSVSDLLILLAQWGPCDEPCSADLDGDGDVDTDDLLAMLGNWG